MPTMPENRSSQYRAASTELNNRPNNTQDYAALSLLDVLKARDLYHLHRGA